MILHHPRLPLFVSLGLIALGFLLHGAAKGDTCVPAKVEWQDATAYDFHNDPGENLKWDTMTTPSIVFGCLIEGQLTYTVISHYAANRPDYALVIPKMWVIKIQKLEVAHETVAPSSTGDALPHPAPSPQSPAAR